MTTEPAPVRPAGEQPPGPFASDDDWSAAIDTYRRHSLTMFLALFARSLPASFCSPEGAAVLDPSSVGVYRPVAPGESTLTGDAFIRLRGTALHIGKFFDADRAQRFRHLRMIRVRHDAWRAEIRRLTADLDFDELPEDDLRRLLRDPLSNEQIFGTACTFVVPVREMFDDFGVPGTGRIDWDAWARVWCDIAVAQGASEQYVREHVGETVCYRSFRDASDEIEARHRSRSLAGVRLMRNVVDDMRDGLPHWSRNSFLTALAVFGEDDALAILLVPPRRGASVLTRVVRRVGRVPILRSIMWWTLRRAIAQVRSVVDAATPSTPVAKLFPGHVSNVVPDTT